MGSNTMEPQCHGIGGVSGGPLEPQCHDVGGVSGNPMEPQCHDVGGVSGGPIFKVNEAPMKPRSTRQNTR